MGNYAKQGITACTSCRVELLEANDTVIEIYMSCRRHCVTRWNGEKDIEIDISIPAIESCMRMRGVSSEQHWNTLQRVRKLWHAIRAQEEEGKGMK